MAERTPRGVAWAGAVNLIGGATGSVMGLVIAAIVGRELGTQGAGTYFLVVAVFMIVSNIAELGADTGLVRHVSAARATGRARDIPHLVVLATRPVVLVGLALVVLSAVAALVWPDLPGGVAPIQVPGLVLLAVLSSLTAVVLAAVRGFGDALSYPLLQNVLLPALRLLGVLVVLLAGGGAAAALTAWVAPVPLVLVLATLILLVTMTRRSGSVRPAPMPPAGRRQMSRSLWSFSAARGVSAAVEILLEWIDVIIVGALTSAEAAGVYAVVTRCARAGEVIQQAARVAVGPQISAALARGAVHEARDLYGLVTAAMIWLAWPFFIILAVFSDAVLSIFGPGFEEGAASLTILSLAMGLATAAGTVQTILLMGGRSRWQLGDKSAALVLNVALNLALVPAWGIEGAAVAWAVTILADTALVVYQVQRLMGLRPHGVHLRTSAMLSVGVVGAAAVATRMVLGSSVTTMCVAIVIAAVPYLALSVPLRHRIGLVELIANRPTA